jgi:Lrp/AsnC family leucine-responsive transcriptional regulator
VRTEDTLSLVHLMRDRFSKIPNIVSTKTTIVLETVKEENYLPVPEM